MTQIVTACNIKQTCINSDRFLRKEENSDFSAVKIETEPDFFQEETVKDEPLDVLDDYLIDYDYLKFDDPMKSVRRIEPEEEPERRTYRYKPSSSSRTKREPPPTSFRCYLCNANFHSRKLKHEHLENSHGNDEFKCLKCRHKSQTARGHDNHLMLHENPELLSHMCHICSKNYQKACELRRHIKLSHSDKSKRISKFFCDFCDFKTFSKMNVKRHLRTIHLKIKAFQCQFCPGEL